MLNLLVKVRLETICLGFKNEYSAHRLIGSRIIESVAYCNQIMLVPLYLQRKQNMLGNWIISLLLSLLGWPKVILLSGHNVLIFSKGPLNCRNFWVVREYLLFDFKFVWTKVLYIFLPRDGHFVTCDWFSIRKHLRLEIIDVKIKFNGFYLKTIILAKKTL